ncbi:threonine/serine exporter family protein [Microbacterium elymi]|uniref:Threonine/serine exporter family protein n=1 Tax=Microbacterium elymi TaxID=2909587 RepID=A0ABY5NMN3_9MICO|nr:threonine/serine exporter family protein [Microbacterium elymi]UUT36374.1 threonine/serine exporter family protein [Microbacterium elymi]
MRTWWSRRLRVFSGEIVRAAFPPTQRVSIPWSDDALSQRHARAVIDLCLRAGETMLATGATTADVVATVLRISATYGLRNVHVDIAFTSITISVHRGLDENPISIMRVVKVRTTDYTRLQAVYRLIDEAVTSGGAIDVDEVRERLGTILNQPHPYRRWIVTLGMAVLAAGVVVMFNASVVLVVVAAASAVIADLIGRRLSKWGIAVFFSQIACAAAITIIAVVMYWLALGGTRAAGDEPPDRDRHLGHHHAAVRHRPDHGRPRRRRRLLPHRRGADDGGRHAHPGPGDRHLDHARRRLPARGTRRRRDHARRRARAVGRDAGGRPHRDRLRPHLLCALRPGAADGGRCGRRVRRVLPAAPAHAASRGWPRPWPARSRG